MGVGRYEWSRAVMWMGNWNWKSTFIEYRTRITYRILPAHVAQWSKHTGAMCSKAWRVYTQTPPIRFVVDLLEAFDLSTTNPQHLDMSRCCGFVVDGRFVVDLLWICCTAFDLLWISCGFVVDFVVQFVVQQIHNKSNRWSLSFRSRGSNLSPDASAY